MPGLDERLIIALEEIAKSLQYYREKDIAKEQARDAMNKARVKENEGKEWTIEL